MLGVPDTPYSLMEGRAGLCIMQIDFLGDDDFIRFPGYEI